jgi:hypothetical protein
LAIVAGDNPLGVVEVVDSGVPVVKMRRWDPFCLAVAEFDGPPTLLGEIVIGLACQSQIVDIG